MMKKMSIVLVFCMIFTLFSPKNVSASTDSLNKEEIKNMLKNNPNTVHGSVTELELITQTLNSFDNELEKTLFKRNLNNQLSRLATNSTSDLMSKGYSLKEANDIQKYKSTDSAIDYITTYGLSNATLSYQYLIHSGTHDGFYVNFIATWNQCPMFCISDTIGVGFLASTSYSSTVNLTYAKDPWGSVDYYVSGSTDTYLYCNNFTPGKGGTTGVKHKFYMSDDRNDSYAKEIYIGASLRTVSGSNNIDNVTICVGYSHCVVNFFPSGLSFSSSGMSIGVSAAYGTEELISDSHTFPYNSWDTIYGTEK